MVCEYMHKPRTFGTSNLFMPTGIVMPMRPKNLSLSARK